MAKKPLSEEEERLKSSNISPLIGLYPFIKPYRRLLWAAIIALVFTAMISLGLPIAVREVIDGFTIEKLADLDKYFTLTIVVTGALAFGTGLRFYFVTKLGERVIADVRMAVYQKVIGLSPAFYEKILTGEVLSRLTTDTTLILSVISSSISVALRNALLLVGGMFFMFLTSMRMTGLVVLMVPIIILPIMFLGRKLRALSRESQDKIAATSGEASEVLLAAQTVQAYTHEEESRGSFNQLTEEAYEVARRRIVTRAILTVSVIFMVFTGVVGILWMGARDVINGIMTPGELVQFLIYSVMLSGAVAALAEIWGELQRAAGATERLIELIEAEDIIKDPENPVPAPERATGDIKFVNVNFTYPARPEVLALKNLNLHIKAGETVALVGPSGAGKSTIFQMLMRFFDPDNGQIQIDNIGIETMMREDMRRAFALVPQDPVIFATTAMENIRFGRSSAPDEEVYAAAKAAAADEFISGLPKGYNSYVGERGIMLSGGQKQRVAIARAILRDSPILLLDEATSSLDAQSELLVQKAVEHLAEDRTTVIIAHRLATVKKADRIVVLDEGQIVAEGTHDALVAEGGLYAKLAKLQFTDGKAKNDKNDDATEILA